MASSRNLGTAVLAVAWTFNGLATMVIAVRYYVRSKIIKKLTVDDGLILFALGLGLGNSICLTISASHGLGSHVNELYADQIMYSIKWVYICEFFSILSPCIGRIAYAFLLLSLVPPIPWRSRLLWSIICLQFVIDCGTVVVSFAQCTPMRRYWDHSVPGSCWPPNVQRNTGYFQSSVCCAVDFVLAIFPASMFWKLNMEWKKKFSLSFLMGLGIFAMIASVVKTIQLRAIAVTDDQTHAMANLAIWWTLEAYLVILAASIPTLRPIVTAPRHASSVGLHAVGSSFLPRGHNAGLDSISEFQLLDRDHRRP
ncbi:integral membrane protein [Aspergillus steynii IBT 23096]|uniref:Integral membrane protein n=1 Tax=Aspergillus steynii IBT 23096 TaxID=1392250 RepID=A0A2I2GFB4_9EURO|nr:uncharacterized protein P170DRAFT_443758 [Aspergillus steynii IBT 23096]PLB51569.1 integral membrane protein [Aspergillus steynii IBT 23096]